MTTALEVNPSACIFVAGPRLTACCRRDAESHTSPSSYLELVASGISAVQELTKFASEEEGARVCQALRDAYERDPGVAASQVVEILHREGCYERWLEETFGHVSNQRSCLASHETVNHLINLQQQGALLACTQYDTIVDELAGTEPVCLDNEAAFDQWLNSKLGFLHLCGVSSQPETVRLDGASLKNKLKSGSKCYASLAEIFKKRLVVFVGYDRREVGPLLSTLVKPLFPEESSLKNPPILITCSEEEQHPQRNDEELHQQMLPGFLTLEISREEAEHLNLIISAGCEKNFMIGE